MQLEDYLGEISKVYGPRRAAYLASAAGLIPSGAGHHGVARNSHGGSAGHEGFKQSHISPGGFLPAIRSTSSSGYTGPTVVSLRKPLAGGFNVNASH